MPRLPQDKENSELSLKSHLGIGSPLPLRDSGQVTVTLTLTSEAAQDVAAVLRSLAALLNIPPPSGYQVIERTGTPPSQKLGLYRHAKGKHGRDQGQCQRHAGWTWVDWHRIWPRGLKITSTG